MLPLDYLYDLYHRVESISTHARAKLLQALAKYFEVGEREGRIVPGFRGLYDLG